MESFTLPPGNKGVTMDRDGTHYTADPTGHIHVDNPAHAAQIRRNASLYIHSRITGFTHLPGERCVCGFNPHAFSASCPRCGRNLKEAN